MGRNNSAPRILVAGSLVMDLIVSTERFPNVGETVLGFDFRTAPGGKGANQAAQAALLGAKIDMAGCVGADENGEQLISSLQKAGVSTSLIRRESGSFTSVGNVQIETGEGGQSQNRIVVVPGANHQWNRDTVDRLCGLVSEYDMLLLQLEIPMWVNEELASAARSAGVPVLLNPAPADKLSRRLLECLTFIAPNESEAALISGLNIERSSGVLDLSQVQAAAERMMDMGAGSVLVTMGDQGAAYFDGTRSVIEPCVKLLKAVDPTAAGDSFIGAFAAAICRGEGIREAMRFANAAAAITVSRMGAQPSLPCLSETKELMERVAGGQND